MTAMRLMTRLYHDELQQTEADTFIGHHIECLNKQQADFDQLQLSFNIYVVQTDRDVSMFEDHVDCVRDGLVNYGGFVKFTEMTPAQRGNMRAQKRSTQQSSELASVSQTQLMHQQQHQELTL
jgi:hypothetical protein